MDDYRELLDYYKSTGLNLYAQVEWKRITSKQREEILKDLQKQAVGGKCSELREMLTETGIQSHKQFLALANQANFDEIPFQITLYLPLYFSMERLAFDTSLFERQYRVAMRLPIS